MSARVLVVDDLLPNVKLLEAKLTAEYFDVVTAANGPDAVALSWSLDGGGARKHIEGGSPDRDYLWLERLASSPIDLSAGQHQLNFAFGGADPGRAALIDGFLLVPVQITKTLTLDNKTLKLTFDIDNGGLKMEESQP